MNVLINGLGRIGKAIVYQNIQTKIFKIYQINDLNLDMNEFTFLKTTHI